MECICLVRVSDNFARNSFVHYTNVYHFRDKSSLGTGLCVNGELLVDLLCRHPEISGPSHSLSPPLASIKRGEPTVPSFAIVMVAWPLPHYHHVHSVLVHAQSLGLLNALKAGYHGFFIEQQTTIQGVLTRLGHVTRAISP